MACALLVVGSTGCSEPERPRVHQEASTFTVEKGTAVADGTETAIVVVKVMGTDSEPLQGAVVEVFDADGGTALKFFPARGVESNAEGNARFKLNTTQPGTYTLGAKIDGYDFDKKVQVTFTKVSKPTTKLEFTTTFPEAWYPNKEFAQIIVELKDEDGNLVTDEDSTVTDGVVKNGMTVSFAYNDTGATLTGNVAAVEGGRAIFDHLMIDKASRPPGQYQLTFRVEKMGKREKGVNVQSPKFSLNVGAPKRIGLKVSGKSTEVSAGESVIFVASILDDVGNVIPTFDGKVNISTTDLSAEVPLTSYQFTKTVGAIKGDEGVHSFIGAAQEIKFKKAGVQKLIVKFDDLALQGEDGELTFTVRNQTGSGAIKITGLPGTVKAGEPQTMTISIEDSFGNPMADPPFADAVRFSTIDPAFPMADYTFTAQDKGTHTFTGVVFKMAGDIELRVSSLNPTPAVVVVKVLPLAEIKSIAFNPIPIDSFVDTVLNQGRTGNELNPAFNATQVVLRDEYGNTITNRSWTDASQLEVELTLVQGCAKKKTPTCVAGDEAIYKDCCTGSACEELTQLKICAPGDETVYKECCLIAERTDCLGLPMACATPTNAQLIAPASVVNAEGCATTRHPAGGKRVKVSNGVAKFNAVGIDQEGMNYTIKAKLYEGVGAVQLSVDGNAVDAEAVVKEINVVDTIKPAKLAKPTATLDRNAITLSWQAGHDDCASGSPALYRIKYWKQSLPGVVTEAAGVPLPGQTLTYTVNNLDADTFYVFAITAIDAAGNESNSDSASQLIAKTNTCGSVGAAAGYDAANDKSCQTCVAGFDHPAGSPTVCKDFCTLAANPCPATPDAAHANVCDANILVKYAGQGACVPNTTAAPYYTCNWTADRATNCAATANTVCFEAECIADPCVGAPACLAPVCSLNGGGISTETCAPLTKTTTQCVASNTLAPTGQTCMDVTSYSTEGVTLLPHAVEATPGSLVVNEIMLTATTRWFEIKNRTASDINLKNLIVEDKVSGKKFTVTEGRIAANGYFVFSAGTLADIGVTTGKTPGGVAVRSFTWPAGFSLEASGRIVLRRGDIVIEDFVYDAPFAATTDTSAELGAVYARPGYNRARAGWCNGLTPISGSLKGTPGAANTCTAAPLKSTVPTFECESQTAVSIELGKPTQVGLKFRAAGMTTDAAINGSAVRNDYYPMKFQVYHVQTANAANVSAILGGVLNAAEGGYDVSFTDTDGWDRVTALVNLETGTSLSVTENEARSFVWRVTLLDANGNEINGQSVYCGAAAALAANATTGFATLTGVVPGLNAQNTQFAAALNAAEATGITTNNNIARAVVTYVQNDTQPFMAGYFIQPLRDTALTKGDTAGLYVESSNAQAAIGKTVTLKYGEKGKQAGYSVAGGITPLAPTLKAITAEAFTEPVVDLSTQVIDVSDKTDLKSNLNSKYLSRYVRISGWVDGAFTAMTTPNYSRAPFRTAGMEAAGSAIWVAMPTSLANGGTAIPSGTCLTITAPLAGTTEAVAADRVPMAMVYEASQLLIGDASACPSFEVTKVVAETGVGGLNVLITFNREVDAASIFSNGAQFEMPSHTSQGMKFVSAVRHDSKTIRAVVNQAMTVQNYTVKWAPTFRDTRGIYVNAATTQKQFAGPAN